VDGKETALRKFALPQRAPRREQRRTQMPQYLYQVAYTPESLAAQI